MTKQKPAPSPSFFQGPQLPLPVAQQPYPYEYPAVPVAGVPEVPSSFDIRVTVSVDRDATVATAALNESGRPYLVPLARATGSAIRHRTDAHDPETATLIATSRAVRKLANQLDKKARGRVRSADADRGNKARSKARRQGTDLSHLVTGGIASDGTVVVHVPPGGADAGMKEMLQGLFPARDIVFQETASVPERIEEFLSANGAGGTRRSRPGRHVKPAENEMTGYEKRQND